MIKVASARFHNLGSFIMHIAPSMQVPDKVVENFPLGIFVYVNKKKIKINIVFSLLHLCT